MSTDDYYAEDPKRDDVEAVALSALNRSVLAIDDWLNVYASELCNEQRVAEAHQRIGDAGGTLAYVAYVQKENRAAIAALDESRAREMGVAWRELVAPMVRICEVAAALDREAVWKPAGAKALGELLKRMAATLDAHAPEIIAPTPGQSDAIRAEVIRQGVDPNSDKAERMGRAMQQNMLRKAERL